MICLCTINRYTKGVEKESYNPYLDRDYEAVGLYLTRDIYGNFVGARIPWATLLVAASYVVMVGVPLAVLGCGLYFRKHLRT